MINVKKAMGATCLATISIPVFALSLHCQAVGKAGAIQQCTSSGSHASNLYAFTHLPYALCSKSLCKIDKKDPKIAHCKCSLYQGKSWKGLSISPSDYDHAKAIFAKNGRLLSVQSNYSVANVATKLNAKSITCQFSKAKKWADCFGARCKVTGRRSAMCTCPVTSSKVFSITGPGGQKKCMTKAHHVWSAILVKDAQTNADFVRSVYDKFYPASPAAKMENQ